MTQKQDYRAVLPGGFGYMLHAERYVAPAHLPVADIQQLDRLHHIVGELAVKFCLDPAEFLLGFFGIALREVAAHHRAAVVHHMLKHKAHHRADAVQHTERQPRQRPEQGHIEHIFQLDFHASEGIWDMSDKSDRSDLSPSLRPVAMVFTISRVAPRLLST